MAGNLAKVPLLRAYTVLSRSTDSILKFLSEIPKPTSDSVVLFSLSLNADRLEPLVSALQGLSRQHVGCLSAPLPTESSKIACSVALLPSSHCETVRTTIPGKKQPQVGRWHVKKRKDHSPLSDEPPTLPADGKWDQIWDRYAPKGEQSWEVGALDNAKSFIFFSDNAPEGLIDALDYQVPRKVAKLGLIGASTPFVTGRPFTLFHNSNIYSSGAVGIALRGDLPSQNDVAFQGYMSISPALRVTDSRGNLIHKLNDSNPTRLLLDNINEMRTGASSSEPAEAVFIAREDEFFVGVPFSVDSNSNETGYQRIYRITSGDPKKGTMSLDADVGPPVGTRVQFLQRSGAWKFPAQDGSQGSTFQFQTTSDALQIDPDRASVVPVDDADLQVYESVFSSASEHGFISSALTGLPLGRGRCWRASILGAQAGLSLST